MTETTAVCTDCGALVTVEGYRMHMAEMHGVMHAPYEKAAAGSITAGQISELSEGMQKLVLELRAERDCTTCTETQPCERARRLLSGVGK